MKEKLIGIFNRTRYSAHIIRAIVGLYVAYTCGKVTVDYFRTDEVTLPMMLGSGAVALCGVAITLLAGWAIAKGYSVEYKGRAPWTIPADEADESEQLPDGSGDEAYEEEDAEDEVPEDAETTENEDN